MKIKILKPVTAIAIAMLFTACNNVPAAVVTDTVPEIQNTTTSAPAEITTVGETTVDEAMFEGKEYRLPATYETLPNLKDVFADDFYLGTAINTFQLEEGTDTYNLALKHFNIFTTENEMKPVYVNPSEGVFDFAAPDKFIAFGDANPDAILRGHTLVWHSQAPEWWFKGSGEGGRATSDELMARMTEYINTTVGRYKGKIKYWDVVNEAFSDSTGQLRQLHEQSYWAPIIGDLDGDGDEYDFIEQAFYLAREADPDAKLIINDYNLEQDPRKLNGFYDAVKSMLEQGVPIDGVGIQAHIQLEWPSIINFKMAIEKLATLKEINPDLIIQVTELDVSMYAWSDQSLTVDMNAENETKLAVRYADLFDMFREEAAKGNLETVVMWGFYDGMSWLNDYPIPGRTNHPLLFDRDLIAKPAFWGVVDRTKIDAAVEEE
ncbi:MAG: endo-1,4-beta-xylanase [Ruminococcus sp.]|jgi:endo-1,4-beta-xylanase|nr:endo-1,4-beta-xylanase [Ruminococcus sp.]